MAEIITPNANDEQKKFVDFEGLDYFWEKSKEYIDESDKTILQSVSDNKTGIEKISDEVNSINAKIDSIEKVNLTWIEIQ